jgi:hypothetical protein
MGAKRKKHKPSYKAPKRRIEELEPPLLVFVSSLIDKMKEERDVADRAIRSIPLTRPWLFEYTPASSQPVRDSYLTKVRECDIFVLILGQEYSAEVTREYETAVETSRPILVFVDGCPREARQEEIFRSIGTKRVTYNSLDELRGLVYVSVLDEIKRTFRSAIRLSDTPKIIQGLPIPVRRLEDISGYLIVGLEDTTLKPVFQMFGAKSAPDHLDTLDGGFEPLFIENLAEMNDAVNAIKNAHLRAQRKRGDPQALFLRELKQEISQVASRYIMSQQTGSPMPHVSMPGIKYFIWGLAPDFARMVRLMRLEGILNDPVSIQREDEELLFKSPEHFIRGMEALQDASREAGGDTNELRRLLVAKAAMVFMDYVDTTPP